MPLIGDEVVQADCVEIFLANKMTTSPNHIGMTPSPIEIPV